MRYCDSALSIPVRNGAYLRPVSARPERAFPLSHLHRLFGWLVARLENLLADDKNRWKGFRLVCADKTTLALPEWPELWEKFGCHKIRKHLGPVGVEFCCIFSIFTRTPIAFAFGKSNTSDERLFTKLVKHVRKGTVVLLDNGFYSFSIFELILKRSSHFIIPASVSLKPKLVKQLGSGDYLAEITCSKTKRTMVVRVLYVYRKGFRRRRIVTSLLDPVKFPSSEIAALYHLRWTVETFYREFKISMQANVWHCQKVDSFEKELVSKLIAACLVRLASAAASNSLGLMPSNISFAKVFSEVKIFLRKIISAIHAGEFAAFHCEFIRRCARYLVDIRPDRAFSREKQVYRRISRNLQKKRVGRPPTKIDIKKNPKPELLPSRNGVVFLLS